MARNPQSWHPGADWVAIIGLRDRLQVMVEKIIVARGIKRARMRCSHCGHVGPGALPVITVRAVILALQRFGVEPQDAVDRLDKAWARHRAEHQLDLRGQPVQARGATSPTHEEEHA